MRLSNDGDFRLREGGFQQCQNGLRLRTNDGGLTCKRLFHNTDDIENIIAFDNTKMFREYMGNGQIRRHFGVFSETML